MLLEKSPKGYTRDQDKANPPEQTVARVKKAMEDMGGVLAETDRVDTGRLGIPVFVSVCAPEAREIMPGRKQMGKGASVDQAEASALMELVERYSFFSYFEDEDNFQEMTWSEALDEFGSKLMDVDEISFSADHGLDSDTAARIMDLMAWRFAPARDVAGGEDRMVPVDWFKMLNEYNGASAGNTSVESILQGGCELVERHVCAVLDKTRAQVPVIDPKTFKDPVLVELYEKFTSNGIRVVVNDFTMGMPVPTVAALAWDPATFPDASEIVFTAGTSATPEKAAIRALTEVAQLAGDFETGRVYEPSGLPKFTSLDQIKWLTEGPETSLSSLPTVEDEDMYTELSRMARGLTEKGFKLYSVDTTLERLATPANFNFVPGFDFRERAINRDMGMFVGRKLAEEAPIPQALAGLEELAEILPGAHYLPFYQGLLALRMENPEQAGEHFRKAAGKQPGDSENALTVFYRAYCLSLMDRWSETVEPLTEAIELDSGVKEYFNLRGVARFKDGDYENAALDFSRALDLDRGSAQDLANLGVCYKNLGRKEEARHALENALNLDPSLENAAMHLAELEG